jgi:putative ABC transport system permease protein
VTGASVGEIVLLLTKDFTRWVILAFVIAAPVAWYIMDRVLMNYAYRIRIGADVFAISLVIALVIALVSSGFQAWRSATGDPAEVLRYQ